MGTYGYFKKSFLMTSREVAELRRLIVDTATAHNRRLDALYIDEVGTAPRELYACFQDASARDDTMLIIPNLLHLTGEGDPRELRAQLERVGFVVVVAQQAEPAGRTF